MNLGVDLEIEILLQLPLKSLMRFICVQRSWNKLIRSSDFLNRRNKLCIPQNRSLLFIEKSELKLLRCETDKNKRRDKPILVKSLFPDYIARIESYGSCNGVFCLGGIYQCTTSYVHDKLIMWNPTTNEVHCIPHSPFRDTGYLYGFGAVEDDFKVVKLHIFNNELPNMLRPLSEVYSLSTKVWTIIHNCPTTMVTSQRPSSYNALVNGVYHWITTNERDASNILCFDFRSNQFRQLKGPIVHHIIGSYSYYDDVIEIKGCLGYVIQNNLQSMFIHELWLVIWVMDQNKWYIKYKIRVEKFTLCRVWNNGAEIFRGKTGELLKSYDFHGNRLHQFQINIPVHTDNFRIYDYIPSIALLSN